MHIFEKKVWILTKCSGAYLKIRLGMEDGGGQIRNSKLPKYWKISCLQIYPTVFPFFYPFPLHFVLQIICVWFSVQHPDFNHWTTVQTSNKVQGSGSRYFGWIRIQFFWMVGSGYCFVRMPLSTSQYLKSKVILSNHIYCFSSSISVRVYREENFEREFILRRKLF